MKINYVFMVSALFASLSLSAQTNYQDWADAGRPDLSDDQSRVAEPVNRGGLITFVDRASFDQAAGVLPLENFNGGLIDAINDFGACDEPLNSASDDDCFEPGNLIAGFDLTSDTGLGLVALGDGFVGPGQSDTVVGAINFPSFAVVTFPAPGVTAIALDVFAGAGGPADVTVRAFDAADNEIGSIIAPAVGVDVSQFVGFTSPLPVARIEIEGAGGTGELFDNFAFGTPPPDLPESQPVPTLGLFGMVLAALMLMMVAVVALRRRSGNNA